MRFQLMWSIQSICIGHGIDNQAIGILGTLILSSVVGLLLWVGINPARRQDSLLTVFPFIAPLRLRPAQVSSSIRSSAVVY
jgi:hypothetical protein